MVGEEDNNGVPCMWTVVERIDNAAELLVGPSDTGEVSVYRLFPPTVLAHPIVIINLT